MSDPRQAVDRAVAAWRAGRFAEAEALCRSVLSIDPNVVEALRMLGLLALQAGQPHAAEPLLRRAVAQAPASADARSHLGVTLLLLGRDEEGAAELGAVLKRKPDHAIANLNLGLRALNAGRLDEATRHLGRARKKAKDDVDVLVAHGVLAAQKGDYAAAVADFRRALRLAPDHPKALLNLGTALVESERYAEGLEVLQRLRPRDPGNPAIPFHLGLAYAGMGDRRQALEAYRTALTLAPDYAPAHVNRAALLWKDARLESALHHLREAQRLRPDDVPVLDNLGGLLMEMKRADAAIEVFRQIRTLDDRDEIAWVILIDALQKEGRFEEARAEADAMLAVLPDSTAAAYYRLREKGAGASDVELDGLARFLDTADLPDARRVSLGFAVGSAYEDRGAYDRAFAYYKRANDLQMERIHHSVENADLWVESVKNVVTPELVARLSAFGSRDERPVFIVGMPRSGTTLLRALLSAHSRIMITPETHLLMWAKPAHRRNRRADERAFRELWSRYRDGFRFRDLGLDPDRVERRVLADHDFGVDHLLRVLGTEYAASHGKARWGEKTPRHYLYLDALLDWFPRSRVLLVLRDPRAVVASTLRTPWDSPKRDRFLADRRLQTVFDRSMEWRQVASRYRRRWRADPRVLLVSYEELVQGVEPVLKTICDHLGERFESGMLTGRTPRPVRPEHARFQGRFRNWRVEHQERASGPITEDRIHAWDRELEPREVLLIEHVCREEMRRHGYPVPPPPPIARRAGLNAALLLRRARWKARRVAERLTGGTGGAGD